MMSRKNKSAERIALITGGAQGIGRGTAEKFLSEKIKVFIADIDDEAGRELESLKKNLFFIHCDVRKEEDVIKTLSLIKAKIGYLDILVNNVGGANLGKKIIDLSLNEWNNIINLNLTAAFLFSKYSIPIMRKGASIINIASTRAFQSEKNTEAYSAAKGGIVSLTHALAISLGPEIRVNCISPGWIRTDGWRKKSENKIINYSEADHKQHPVGRIGSPDDIANLAYFLSTDEAAFITGQNFISDGGMTKKMIYI